MASRSVDVRPPSPAFPARGVAAGIQRAVAAARGTGYRLAGAAYVDRAGRGAHVVDRTFQARRLHIVRRESLRRVEGASGPSRSA